MARVSWPLTSSSCSGMSSLCSTSRSWSMSSEVVISCHNVGKAFQLYVQREDQLRQAIFGFWRRYYKEHWVLHDISFEIRRGERVGIIGRNGAGKTTLLQILCGITKPTHGSFDVKGRVGPILA